MEIASTLVKYGFAERLDQLEPGFVQRFLNHEGVADLAKLSMGERARLACEELGPTFVKLGQILSTRPDVVSPEVAAELAHLQSGAAADPFEDVQRIVEKELGCPIAEAFAAFDREPLASASIGQVHAARLHSGESVVVKVQHPGILKRVETDFDILLTLARLLDEHDERARAYQLELVADEARRTLLKELDFQRELRSLVRFRAAFAEDDAVVIPAPYPEQSGRRVLTMERVVGVSVADGPGLAAAGHDLSRLALAGVRIFLDMVFRHGAFHADPHPGNVLVQPDGRIALIDFGMVGLIDNELRDDLVDLLVAFVRDDVRATERAVEAIAILPHSVDSNQLRRDLSELQSELGAVPMDQADVSAMLEEFSGLLRRHHVRLPPNISMLIKVLVMLEGTAHGLDRRFSLMQVLQPYCGEIVKERMSVRSVSRRSLETSREWLRLGRRLPQVLDQAARRVERGDLKVDLVHSGLERTVDRMVSGVLCAAMMLGGSVLWAMKAPPVIFGVPVIGVAATLASLVHGFRLLRKIKTTPSD